jgi:SPP1 family predicted phage head-tail adaptor
MPSRDTWTVIDPGEFRHRITLLQATAGSDASGSTVTYIPDNVQAWAKIKYLRGIEAIKAGLDVTQTYLEVTMWYRPEFTADQHIQGPNGNEYIVQSVENVNEINQYTRLTCLGLGTNN